MTVRIRDRFRWKFTDCTDEIFALVEELAGVVDENVELAQALADLSELHAHTVQMSHIDKGTIARFKEANSKYEKACRVWADVVAFYKHQASLPPDEAVLLASAIEKHELLEQEYQRCYQEREALYIRTTKLEADLAKLAP